MASVQGKAMYVLQFFETESAIKTQRRYRTQYGKAPPSDNAIRRSLQQYQETGSVLHREDPATRRKMLTESKTLGQDILRATKCALIDVV
jgi:hypothetical protein